MKIMERIFLIHQCNNEFNLAKNDLHRDAIKEIKKFMYNMIIYITKFV